MKTESKIRAARQRCGISQAALADMLYYSQDTICKWERGAYRPPQSVLEKIADICGCDVADLQEEPIVRGEHYYPRLAKEMQIKGVKQYDIAQKLGIGQSTLSCKMNGHRDWKTWEIFAIRDLFFPDVSLEELFYAPFPSNSATAG